MSSTNGERAIVLRERSAAARTRCNVYWQSSSGHHRWDKLKACQVCVKWAEGIFPLPQRQTIRYEPDPHDPSISWYVHDQMVCAKIGDELEYDSVNWSRTFARLDLWQSLRDRPFNLTDDDGEVT